jgi:hypothetical protein
MAFRRDALASIGGFDVALGAGTPAQAGEDTLALTMLLLEGHRIAYEPAALTRHHHRADMAGLSRQLQGYGVGLTAFYAALLRHRPGLLPRLIRLAPAAASFRRHRSALTSPPPDAAAALGRHPWGMLAGPAAYARSVRRQARVAGRDEEDWRQGRDHEPVPR